MSELVDGGTECVVGVSTDELFGPTVMFGLGGVFVEVLRDVTFRVPPFDLAEARRMIDEVQGAALLRGARGRPKGDVRALVDAIVQVQRLALDQSDRARRARHQPARRPPEGRRRPRRPRRPAVSDAVAVAGVGQTAFAKSLAGVREGAGAEAIRPRSTTPGSRRRRSTGCSRYTLETTEEVDIARNLGLGDVTSFAQVGYGGGAGCGVVGQAAMAVAAGQCDGRGGLAQPQARRRGRPAVGAT